MGKETDQRNRCGAFLYRVSIDESIVPIFPPFANRFGGVS